MNIIDDIYILCRTKPLTADRYVQPNEGTTRITFLKQHQNNDFVSEVMKDYCTKLVI